MSRRDFSSKDNFTHKKIIRWYFSWAVVFFPGLIFYQDRMPGLKLIDSDEGVETHIVFVFLFCHELSSAMYAKKFTNIIETGCQPARVKSQRVECSLR